ncbi:hypothetical protein SPSIL_018400 [Sporomusa silvacetica DSM 10669]|uniref:Right handed beta helix domain-containing protein n=1 Tax=Sporomusa silvacetica DSM 10669 TaxID=1123289 RepID=A0ABZ3IJB9_9FIRM|nr:hypothetical protein [Sporomusa silvacetica]OZC18901.1 hypothetical protein SPSIL_25150 [Sporomusa silvacetica DSM 10669]
MNKNSCRIWATGLIISLATGFSICNAQTTFQQTVQEPPPFFDGAMQGPPPGGMQPTKDINTFKGAYVLDGVKDRLVGKTIEATEGDENTVLLKNGAQLTLESMILNKSGDTTSGDGSNFNGQNAVFLATGNSAATIKNSEIYSNSEGSNAIFATGNQTKVIVQNVKIHTKSNSSRGLDATYNGTIIADDVHITTEGTHCAPLATDRGEGTVTVTNAILSSDGEGSPCIYSTGNITVNNSVGNAAGSECAVVEGKNSITLNTTSLTGNVKNGVMLYQSFSGDANTGIARFNAKDSTLTSNATGAMFYVTNTQAEATLENTNLNFPSGVLINVTSDRWGKENANGGDFIFTGIRQKLAGDILVNSISTITVNLTQNTTLCGAINKDKTAKMVTLNMDANSSWDVTDDSYVTIFSNADQTLSNIKTNGHTIYYNANETENSWLRGETHYFVDGGKIEPLK